MSGPMEVSDAWAAPYRGADHGQAARDREAPGAGNPDAASGQEGGDHGPDLLPLASALRGDERGRGAALEAARAGEPAAASDRGRAGAGYLDAQGLTARKKLSPARRRDAVTGVATCLGGEDLGAPWFGKHVGTSALSTSDVCVAPG